MIDPGRGCPIALLRTLPIVWCLWKPSCEMVMKRKGEGNRLLAGNIHSELSMLMINRILVFFLCLVLLLGPIPAICCCCPTADAESHKKAPDSLRAPTCSRCEHSGRTCCQMPSSERMGCCDSGSCVSFGPNACNCSLREQNPINQGTPPPKASENETISNRLQSLMAGYSTFCVDFLARGTTPSLFDESSGSFISPYSPRFLVNHSILR